MGEVLRTLKERSTDIGRVPLAAGALAGLIRLIDKGVLSSSTAKDVFAKMYDSGRTADEIVAAEGLAQIDDESALVAMVRDVMARNPDAIAQVKAGKNNAFGFLVGQIMKGSGGKANPKLANQLLKRELERPT
jgi:aspartyl-tRNA(Asn)/glutamyl-tRNA(Gln) amidotransferase subunit B